MIIDLVKLTMNVNYHKKEENSDTEKQFKALRLVLSIPICHSLKDAGLRRAHLLVILTPIKHAKTIFPAPSHLCLITGKAPNLWNVCCFIVCVR